MPKSFKASLQMGGNKPFIYLGENFEAGERGLRSGNE